MRGNENDRKTVDDYRERNVALKKRNNVKKESKVGRADSKEMTFCYGDSKELVRFGAAEKSSRFTCSEYEISRPFVISDQTRLLLGKVETTTFDHNNEEKDAIIDQNQDEMSFQFSMTRDSSIFGSAKTVDDFIDITKKLSEEKLIDITKENSDENLQTTIENKFENNRTVSPTPAKQTSQKEIDFLEIIDICKLNEVTLKKEYGRNKSDEDMNKRNSLVFDDIGKFELIPLNMYNSQRKSSDRGSSGRNSSRDSVKSKKNVTPKSDSKIDKNFFPDDEERQFTYLSPDSNHKKESADNLSNQKFNVRDVSMKIVKGENEMANQELTGMHKMIHEEKMKKERNKTTKDSKYFKIKDKLIHKKDQKERRSREAKKQSIALKRYSNFGSGETETNSSETGDFHVRNRNDKNDCFVLKKRGKSFSPNSTLDSRDMDDLNSEIIKTDNDDDEDDVDIISDQIHRCVRQNKQKIIELTNIENIRRENGHKKFLENERKLKFAIDQKNEIARGKKSKEEQNNKHNTYNSDSVNKSNGDETVTRMQEENDRKINDENEKKQREKAYLETENEKKCEYEIMLDEMNRLNLMQIKYLKSRIADQNSKISEMGEKKEKAIDRLILSCSLDRATCTKINQNNLIVKI